MEKLLQAESLITALGLPLVPVVTNTINCKEATAQLLEFFFILMVVYMQMHLASLSVSLSAFS